jgi:phthiocerol/phenolphthiocerol synthesis type-I polyketide synthase E
MTEILQENGETGLEIAVIGMAGRFPGARNIEEFWDNLKNGIETIAFFSEQELEEAGVPAALLQNPNYIKALPRVEDIECFDAEFFDYTPKEAEIMDPQMRVFHECAYHALEEAGYDPYTYDKLIGCYAGASVNFYWQWKSFLREEMDMAGSFEARQLFDKEYLCTRVAHKLNLRGPAICMQTACSTSLVAIHMACQGLLGGECDLALAGGVSLPYIKKEGYLYRKGGMIVSSDGHCKVFEARSDGTVFGNGVGVVLLKRLFEARQDRDNIHAVVKGSFINNDGLNRGGFTAPSALGEAAAIRTALQAAEVTSESIGYVETHSTGTPLGGPIELEGLKLAYQTDKKNYCALSCVKTNVGHLNIASGVTGFIKAVLALKHRLIPPTLHFHTPDPAADLENSPFYVNTVLSPWKNNASPRRAGVNSFGIGGTNAHVILEEAPVIGHSSLVIGGNRIERQYQLILLSAKTASALEKMTGNLTRYLEKNRDINLPDAAYTLIRGRRTLKHRRMMVCSDVAEAQRKLSQPVPGKVHTFFNEVEKTPVIFMFPGLGSQYVNMGKDLYQTEPFFREEMDRCFEILKPLLEYDIKEILYPGSKNNNKRANKRGQAKTTIKSFCGGCPDASRGQFLQKAPPLAVGDNDIHQPEIAQPAIFAFEYSLARLLMKWGIQPYAMIGYSFGEYTAACISGVLSLEDALKMIALRGKLIGKLPAGAMLSVPLTVDQLKPFLDHHPRLSLAIDNGPSCIAAGPVEAIQAFEKEMKEHKFLCMRIQSARALHSPMMEPILKEFTGKIAGEITLTEPQIPYISNVTGEWTSPGEVTQPVYWANHLRSAVRFADGINQLMEIDHAVFIEIGPGRDLNTLLTRHLEEKPGCKSINLVRPREQQAADIYVLLNRLGHLWLWGVEIDWEKFYAGQERYRVPLPGYPFAASRFPLEMDIVDKTMAILFQLVAGNTSKDLTGEGFSPAPLEKPHHVPVTKPLTQRPGLETEYISPRDEIEGQIADTWSQLFGFEQVGIDDDFFELGGDSLKALIVITKMNQMLGVELSMEEFFRRPTIRTLAPFLAGKARVHEEQLLPGLLQQVVGSADQLPGPGKPGAAAGMEKDLQKYLEQPVVLLNPGTSAQKKLFCFPPVMGFGAVYKELAAFIPGYSLYSFNFIEDEDRLKKYVEIITAHQPQGPYVLFGYSAAGRLTFAVAGALENRGDEVSDIILVESFWPVENISGDLPEAAVKNIAAYLEKLGAGFLQEKIVGLMKKYRAYFIEPYTPAKVNAHVHLILSPANKDTPLSGCWEPFTTKTSRVYYGFGPHMEMLYPGFGFTQKNAGVICEVLAKIN